MNKMAQPSSGFQLQLFKKYAQTRIDVGQLTQLSEEGFCLCVKTSLSMCYKGKTGQVGRADNEMHRILCQTLLQKSVERDLSPKLYKCF